MFVSSPSIFLYPVNLFPLSPSNILSVGIAKSHHSSVCLRRMVEVEEVVFKGDIWTGRKLWGWIVKGGMGVHSDRWTCSRYSHPPHTHTHTHTNTYLQHSTPPPLPRVERPGLSRPDKATGTSGGGGSVAYVTVRWMQATNTLRVFA